MTPRASRIGDVAPARLAVCAGIAAAVLAAADSAAAPTLRLMKTNPVAVKATGFHSGEAVRITVKAGHTSARASARADRRGRFSATVRGIAAPACVSLVVVAKGASGSRAVYRRYPLCATHGLHHSETGGVP
jgi:hypothetical protein